MRYMLAAAALKLASENKHTRSVYEWLSSTRNGPRKAFIDQGQWILDRLPSTPARILDLGTGWAHAYALYPALTRDDEIYCFDVRDCRRFESFKGTIENVHRQLADRPEVRSQRAADMREAVSFEDAYRVANMHYHADPSGIPVYPERFFDAIFSVDVLEHVDAKILRLAAHQWFRILKSGGRFMAQVGIDDHLSHYDGYRRPKRYLSYSQKTWNRLLGNSLQYVNRVTASQLVAILRATGLETEEVKTHKLDACPEVHPDYKWQSEDDVRAVRLFVVARKP
jgi:SAM-dependent methyltransferase